MYLNRSALEIANIFTLLASPAATYIIDTSIPVDVGLTRYIRFFQASSLHI
jgi:hypothetical protein